jgi:hypothetical protein
VVDLVALERRDAARVVEDGLGVDAAADRAARRDLGLHRGGAGERAVLGDGRVRVLRTPRERGGREGGRQAGKATGDWERRGEERRGEERRGERRGEEREER